MQLLIDNRRNAVKYRAEQLVEDLTAEARRLRAAANELDGYSVLLTEYIRTGPTPEQKHSGLGRWTSEMVESVARPTAREMGQLIEDARRLDTLEEVLANLLLAQEELAEQQ
jgi:hypothetical protein